MASPALEGTTGWRAASRDWTMPALAAALPLLLGGGFVLPEWATFLLTAVIAKALVVLGLLVLARAGLVPFGWALFYALGAYAAGLALQALKASDAFLALLIGVAAASLVAVVLGALLARYRDIFFAMLSLAFSMILYGLLVKTASLGGTDGFNLPSPTYLGYAPHRQAATTALYCYAVVLLVPAMALVHRYLASTRGRLAPAIRDNEIRVEYLGASVRRAIQVKLGIAGALAGAGGVLSALAVGHIDPGMAYWTSSGEFVFVTILAGAGSVFAPLIGALVFETVRSFAVQYSPETWQMALGTVLLLVIVFLPGGLWSVVARLRGARA
jgi:branched-chain amino acid transport system permease protein